MLGKAIARSFVAAAIVAVLAGGTQVWAEPAMTGFTDGAEYDFFHNMGDGSEDVVGWRFEVTTPILVTGLGVWAEDNQPDGAGLNSLHEVGIWDASQTLLASTIVDPATAWTDGAFAYQSISSLALSPAETYTIGAVYTDVDFDAYISGASTIDMVPEVSWLGSCGPDDFILGFVYPALDTTSKGRFGPNFQFVVVPEPGTLALLTTGLIGLLCYAWRKRK